MLSENKEDQTQTQHFRMCKVKAGTLSSDRHTRNLEAASRIGEVESGM